jgi:site-specific DNA-cytosine methylase
VIAATLKQRGRGARDEVMDNLQVAGSLAAHSKKHGHAMTTQQAAESNHLVSMPLKAKANSSHDESHETYVTHALRSEGADASEDGTGRGTPIIPIDMRQASRGDKMTNNRPDGSSGGPPGTGIDNAGDPCPTIAHSHVPAVFGAVANCFNGYTGGPDDNDAQANHLIAFSSKDHGADAGEISPTLRAQNFKDSHINGGGQVAIAFGWNKSESQTMRVDDHATDALQASATSNPAIAFTERTRTDGRNFEAQEELAYAVTNPGSGGRTHSRQIAGGFGVRRLTPRECERLQGFPDIESEVIVEICLDPHAIPASAENQNPKSQKRASNAERNEPKGFAQSAESRTQPSNQSEGKRAPLSVLIDCGETEIEISSQGKLISYANTAGRQSGCPLPIKVENFVPLIAGISSTAGQIIRDGKAALPVSEQYSTHQENGRPLVRLFGKEITRLVSDAIAASITQRDPTKSITLNPSRLSSSELKLAISCSSVWAAMIGCIPELTSIDYSCLRLQLNTNFGWTAYDANGKEISDSARYRMLGNAVAVPVARWIGQRLVLVVK